MRDCTDQYLRRFVLGYLLYQPVRGQDIGNVQHADAVSAVGHVE